MHLNHVRIRSLFLSLALPLLMVCRASDALSQQADTTAPAPPQTRGAGALLDVPVNRATYVLGPGDLLDVSIFGGVNRVFRVAVTPEGTVVIPTIGVATLLGLNLNQAQARVRDLVLRYYRDVQVNVNLAEVREFKVFVVGNVPAPGVRTASSVTRVSEIVPIADNEGVVHRNVVIRRAQGDTMRVDLARFRQLGDLASNPTLRQGDVLVVPTIDETVRVLGRVFFPGLYEHRRGETLADLLVIANGSQDFPSNAADTVRVTRFVGQEEREFFTFSRAEAQGPRGQAFQLEPFDAIYVSLVSNYKVQRAAVIRGQVLRPGVYPIRPDTTTVRDLVALAGGFTPEASIVNSTLRRSLPEGGQTAAQELERTPAELLSSEERQILRIRSQGGANNVVIDFQALFARGENAYDQPLRAGDELDVPTRRDEVSVLGAVRQPGIIQFTAGQPAGYFVERAGGFSRLADRRDAVVLRPNQTGRVALADVTSVGPGDTIIVPYRERRSLLGTLQTLGTVTTTIASIAGAVLTYLAIVRSS